MRAIFAALVVLVLFGFPFGAASFFEWSFLPGEWSQWTRLALAVVYSGYFAIGVMAAADEIRASRGSKTLRNVK